MNIHEFQGKSILKAYNVDIQEGSIAENFSHAVMVAEELQKKFNSKFFET